jgi:signal transduction histidine kinase
VLPPLAVLLDVWSEGAVAFAFVVAPPLVAAAIGVAVLRYRLYAIDVILNRTLVFSILTAVVAVLYVGTVSVLGAVFAQRSDVVRSLAATMLIAAVFQPARTRLQLAVDRLLYGDRSRPYEAVTRLGKRLETAGAPQAALPGVVETVAQSLRLPYAEIVLRSGSRWVPAATWGTPHGEPIEFPLVHQGATIGKLLVAPRSPGEVLGSADRHLLTDLSRQVSVAAHAVQLTTDLLRSRAELVTAREEERRRLRRDLHDGLGPVLAGVTLGLDVAHGCVRADPAAAEDLIADLKRETQHAVKDIRRLVYGLRPPALDELGACQALREQVTRLTQADDAVSIRLECTEETLAALPAAVEVALYRIAVEAITNVVRHAQASTCVVRFPRTAHGIDIEVVDDGRGLPPDLRPGVGTGGMRERAHELGGSILLERRPSGGTLLHAHLPLPESEPAT